MKTWDDNHLSLNIYKHGKGGIWKLNQYRERSLMSRCIHRYFHGWNMVTNIQGRTTVLRPFPPQFWEFLGFNSLYIKVSRSYFNGSEIPKINIIKMYLLAYMIQSYYHKSNLTVFNIIWHLAGEDHIIQNMTMMVPVISAQNKVPFGVVSLSHASKTWKGAWSVFPQLLSFIWYHSHVFWNRKIAIWA